MVNTYALQSGGWKFESLWGFDFFLKGAHYEVDYSGKNLLSWTAMHIDFVMCKKSHESFSKIFKLMSTVSRIEKYSKKVSKNRKNKHKKVRQVRDPNHHTSAPHISRNPD